MRCDRFGDIATLMRPLASLLYGESADVAADSITREEPPFGLVHSPPGAQDFEELWGEHDIAIRNRNTRAAYARACWQFFEWCAAHGLELTTVRPFHVAAWIEDFPGSKPTIKQKLAAVRMLYDFLVVRQITPSNPAHSVRGPCVVVKKGKTPVWSREEAKTLLDSIPKDSVSGLRDRALIAAMFYSFARVSAVLSSWSMITITMARAGGWIISLTSRLPSPPF